MSVNVITFSGVLMHVFVTGASGWIGSAVVDQLLTDGHEITGLARSDASAAAVEAKGARVLRGDLDDLAALRAGADGSDGVVHLANKHDWTNMAATNAAERAAVETIADALVGSDRPLLVASGVAALAPGRAATEDDTSPFVGVDAPRGGSENLALSYTERGVRAVSLRFAPTVHGMRDHGFVSILAAAMREKGVAAYAGDGAHAWAAVHRTDAARLVSLGVSKAPAGARLHAVAETGVPTREIAEALGRALSVPAQSVPADELNDYVGWLGMFFGMDLSATSTATQELLGWTPTGPSLIEDIDAGAYG
jgi:nucleoside-diphosphate-sugar epimerase